MGCTYFGFNINNDQDDKIRNVIESIASSDNIKKLVLAGYTFNEEFIKYCNEVYHVDKLTDINEADLTKAFEDFYNRRNLSIRKDLKRMVSESTEGFTSEEAKVVALNYCADVIISKHYENIDKIRNRRSGVNTNTILAEVEREITNAFIISYFNTRAQILKNDKPEVLKEHNAIIKKMLDNNTKIKELEEIAKNATDAKAKKAVKTDINNLEKENKKLRDEALKIKIDICTKYGTEQEKNFANLVSKIHSPQKYAWEASVFLNSKLTSLTRDYTDNLEYEKSELTTGETEEDIINYDAESVDEMSKSWSDSIAASYDKMIGTDIRLYLDSIYKLNSPDPISTVMETTNKEGEKNKNQDANKVWSYDTNNPLGVKTTMGGKFIIHQLINSANFNSLQEFYNSIDKLARSNPNFYGIAQIADRMLRDINFAKRLFCQLACPKVNKIMAIINETGDVEISKSNKTTEALGYITFNLINQIKETYKFATNLADVDELLEIRETIKKYKTDSNYIKADRSKIESSIVRICTKYFPNLDSNDIISYLYKNSKFTTVNSVSEAAKVQYNMDMNKNPRMNSAIVFIDNLIDIVNESIECYKANIAAVNKFNKEYAAYNRAIQDGDINPYKAKHPVMDLSGVNIERLNKHLVKLARKLVDYSTVKNELNTVNAENHLASDIIKNNYIMNLMKQIKYGNEEDSNAGLERLKEFVTQGSQYVYSPLFFGVSINGRQISEGLFIRKGNDVLINPNAKKLIDVALFDGTKDSVNNKAAMYTSMSKGDYFLTQIYAYYSFIKSGENIDISDEEMSATYGQFFLRTPSDAPKNFVLQAPKLSIYSSASKNTGNLYQNYGNQENAYVDTIERKLNTLETIEDSIVETKHMQQAEKWYKGTNFDKTVNIIDGTELYRLLTTNEIGDLNVVNSYCVKAGNQYLAAKMYYKDVDNDINKRECIVLWFSGTKNPGANTLNNAKLIKVQTNVGTAISNYVSDTRSYIVADGVTNGSIKQYINTNNGIAAGFRQHLLGELNTFVSQLNNVFERIVDEKTGKIIWVTKTNTKHLFPRAHYNERSGKIVDNGKLTGNFFRFAKFFNANGYSANEDMIEKLSLYGGGNTVFSSYNGSNDRLVLNLDNGLIREENGTLTLTINNNLNKILDKVTCSFIDNFGKVIEAETENYKTILEENKINGEDITINMIKEAMFNTAIMYMTFDDFFEGSSAFYKDARDFLKRAKEVQAGGYSYGNFDINDRLGQPIKNVKGLDGKEYAITINGRPIMVNNRTNTGIEEGPLMARNGFRAVTIQNTVRSSMMAPIIKDELLAIYEKNGVDKEVAEKLATDIARGFVNTTKVNDAQSYITFEEFIRRCEAEGTLNNYKDLINQILDVRNGVEKEFTTVVKGKKVTTKRKMTIYDIDLKGIASRIQVQKNFYYDIAYDPITKTFYPRQIKNAEFVLIPELIEGTELHKLWEIMNKYDIGQVNTVETTKAAKKNILTFWDDNGVMHADEFEQSIIEDNFINVEDFYYRYLYKQQDVPQHMVDEENKAGIQIIKKIIDNADLSDKTIKENIDNFFSAYCANIKHSFNVLMRDLNWRVNADGSITNADGSPLTFEQFYKKALHEAQRLGLNSNFLEYLNPNELGQPTMPNFMNNVSSKLESIAQSIFNSAITRQKLPGWHGAQVTSVGHGVKVRGADGKYRELKYHPATYKLDNKEITYEEYTKLSEEDKAKCTIVNEAYIEIMIPRWSNLIPKGKTPEENEQILKDLEAGNLTIQIGYRIPTEGKQSISICKVVGILDDIYGSTVMVPDEWVTQTGSDFDVDSIYAIYFEFYKNSETGKYQKIEYDYRDDKILYGEYINRLVEEELDRELVSDDDKRAIIDEAKARAKSEAGLTELNKAWDRATVRSNALVAEIYNIAGKEFGDKFKKGLIDIHKKYNKPEELVIRHNEFVKYAQSLLARKDNEGIKDILSEFADVNKTIVETHIKQKAASKDFADIFNNVKDENLRRIFEESKYSRYKKAVELAKQLNLVSFEEFSKWSIDDKQSQRARNNRILESMINIMKHANSREENYSSSHFRDLTEAKDKNDLLRIGGNIIKTKGYKKAYVELKETKSGKWVGYVVREVKGNTVREEINIAESSSPYNPYDQIEFMNNAMSGAKLKAFSVTRDTFNSVNNYIKSELENSRAINVIYDNNDKTSVVNAIAAYGDNVKMFDNKGKITTDIEKCVRFSIKHNRLANSSNNRNVVGRLITVYGSQTTAHILDAVKEGTVYNENDYTFSMFKTMLDVGIDYETAIALLMQPGVSEIVNANNEKNSIYITDNSNPINRAINRIAKRLNLIDSKGEPIINDYTKRDSVLDILSKNEDYVKASQELFGVNINELDGLAILSIPLDVKMLQNRLQEAVLSKKVSKLYADTVFDIYVVKVFNAIKNTGDVITNLARCSNPDNFGAKQTINATRRVIKDIIGYAIGTTVGMSTEDREKFSYIEANEFKYANASGAIMVNGKPLMQALYPGIIQGNIRIEDSAYPYLASFVKYATEVSVNTNKKIFALESDEFDEILDKVQLELGTILNDEQYKEYKQYIVADCYNSVHFVITPITIDPKTGLIKNDITRIKEYEAKRKNDRFWDYERSRIFGYDVTESASFEIKDIDNPTEDELYKFNALTPAQKVIWVKTHILNNKGIFGFIDTNTFNQYEFRAKGFSGQTITFNDQIDNIEEVFRAFRDSFYHTNPIIRLAAIDLIKYAFVVEGFKFKKNSISKLIPNDVMYNVIDRFGLDIINNQESDSDSGAYYGIKTAFSNVNHANENADIRYIEKFIRSHSELAKEVKLPSLRSEGRDITQFFNRATDKDDGLVTLTKDEKNGSRVLDYLGINNETSKRKYIRITRTINKTKTTTLYKIVRSKSTNFVYLIPLNLLERNETANYSANFNNNKFPVPYYYESIIKIAERASTSYLVVKSNSDEEVIKKHKKLNTVDKHIAEKVYEAIEDRHYLQKSVNLIGKIRAIEVQNFLNDIRNQLTGLKSYILITNESLFLKNIISGTDSILQYITDENGNEQLVSITRDNGSNRVVPPSAIKAIRNGERRDNDRSLTDETKEIIDRCVRLGIKYPTIYKVSKVTEQEVKNIEDTEEKYRKDVIDKLKEPQIDELDEDDGGRLSITSSVSSSFDFTSTESEYTESDKIAKEICIDIQKQHNNFERELYDGSLTPEEFSVKSRKVENLRRQSGNFLKNIRRIGIDLTDASSIHENKGLVYKNAVEYYQTVANIYINKFERFIDVDGRYLSIADEELYDYIKGKPELYNELVQLFLEAKTFGSYIQNIFDTQILIKQTTEEEDLRLRENVEKIKAAIASVRNNSNIGAAFKLLFNKYFAEEFATNPMLKPDKVTRRALTELRDKFGDIDWLDLQFSDIGELRHNQIQVVAKYIYSVLGAATRKIAPQNVAKFEQEWNEKVLNKHVDVNKFITKEGKFISDHTDKFIEDKRRFIDELDEIAEREGVTSRNYVYKHLEFEKWKRKYSVQEMVDDYYDHTINNLENVLSEAENLYLEYNKLIHDYYSTDLNLSKEEESARRKEVTKKLSLLLSYYNEDGSSKGAGTKYKIDVLRKYIARKKELNNIYFDDINKLEYENEYVKNFNFISEYDATHTNETFTEKLQYPPYKEAYDWIKENVIYDIQPEKRARIAEAYSKIMDNNNPYDNTIKDIIESENAYDEYGRINPLLLSNEAIERIKQHTEDRANNYPSHIKFIKDKPIIKNLFYGILFGESEMSETDKLIKADIGNDINKILAIGFINGEFNTTHFLNNVTLEQLAQLEQYVKDFNKIGKRDSEDMNFELIEKHSKRVLDTDTFNKMLAEARRYDASHDDTKFEMWLKIFAGRTKDGSFLRPKQVVNGFYIYDNSGFVPSYDFFGYLSPRDESFIDREKMEALKFIKDNVEYVTTQYYKDAKAMARRADLINPGAYAEWYNRNHVFNIRTGEYEPLRIWTEQHIKADNTMGATYTYRPTYNNAIHSIKESAKNKNYNRFRDNYRNDSDSRYKNPEYNLTNDEYEALQFLRGVMRYYASNYKTSKFVEQGYLPRRAVHTIDKNFIVNNVLGMAGINFGNDFNNSWTDDDHMNYANDRDNDFDMMNLLKTKGTRDIPEYPKREASDTDETYKAKIEQWKEDKKEIEAENLKLDNEILDRDWLNVFKDFISRATEYNTKQRLKNTAYILLEDLKQNNAYRIHGNTGNVIRNKKLSTNAEQIYQDTSQTSAYKLWQNWIRRVFFDEFKKDSSMVKWANLMQNVTSAKYMIFNVTGGIANVGTGMANIFNEVFASEYFDNKTIHKAKGRYFKNTLAFIADRNSEKGSTRDSAIIKLFDVVDYDAMLERRPNETVVEYTKRVNRFLYSMQSGGEHYMQNTVLFAMLESHRGYEVNGKIHYGTFEDYTIELEKDVMFNLLNTNTDYIREYAEYFEKISDHKLSKDFIEYKKDINQEFLRYIKKKYNDAEFVKKYIQMRKEAVKEAKHKFYNEFKTLDSQIIYNEKTKEITFKEDSGFDDFAFGEFRQKVIQVNKRIHGVYDKIGAARLESEWFGSLVMQYHKHIYPGFIKRFRRRGTYNEIRGTAEIGSYTSLYRLATMEFDENTIARDENHQVMVVKTIQNVLKATINSAIHIGENFQTLPIWQQRNIMRVLGDACGITAAMLIAFSIYAMTDEDDEKESEMIATGLYIADRLLAEAQMYTPWGVISEAKTLWSSPIAAWNGPGDIIKGLNLISQWAFDDEFSPVYTTGRYKNENKFVTLVYRNIPAYRVYNRLSHMTKNNSYYRLNNKEINMKLARSLADYVNPD